LKIVDLSYELVPTFLDDKAKLSSVDMRSVYCFFFKPDPQTDWHIAHLFSTSTHCGTHLEAPYHWTKEGKDIASVPLESLIGPAIKLDFSKKKADESISLDEVKESCKGKLKRGDMVFLQTGHGKLWGTDEYWLDSPSLSVEAAKWLLAKGVKLVGIDAPRLDRFTGKGRERYIIHEVLHGNNVLVIENMAHLEEFKGKGTAFVLPMKVRGLDAFPARVIILKEA